MSALNVKPIYTLVEMAKGMGMSRRRVLRLLRSAGITTELMRHQHIIYASDLQSKLPRLWQSFVVCDLRSANQVKG